MNYYNFKKILFYFLVFACSLAFFSSCEKSDDTSWLYYAETYCSDPWGEVSAAEEERQQEIVQYLVNTDIDVYQVEITDEGTVQFCYACHCTTGKLIKCKVKVSDADKLKNLGFFE